MTGLDGQRVYLDWNATAPLRPEARAAMLDAMDRVGNPSSVHAEGRAAKKIVETARRQVCELMSCEPSEVIFTSGATEAAGIWFSQSGSAVCAPIEHDAVYDQVASKPAHKIAGVSPNGQIDPGSLAMGPGWMAAVQSANSETGVIQAIPDVVPQLFSDMTQSAGKRPVAFRGQAARAATLSAHKFGGPKGAGALLVASGVDLYSTASEGGGQEKGRRSGTENIIGIAGFGAAAMAAHRDLEAGIWDRVKKLRIILEETLAAAAPDTIFFGQESPRLPNTSCFAVPGWRGETQVMQMDLAGFAVSAGSACSSGKVNRASRVLMAMGFDEITASSAIRVSMGPTTTEAEVMAFAQTWIEHYNRRRKRAA